MNGRRTAAMRVAATVLILTAAAAGTAAAAAIQTRQQGPCSAQAPEGWTMTVDPKGAAAELQSADRALYTGWGITAIDRVKEPYYGPMYSDPMTSIAVLTNTILQSLGDPGPKGYYQYRYFQSPGTIGAVVYRIYPVQWPQSYIESVRWAIVRKSERARWQGALDVTMSTRCQTQPQGERGR